MAIEVGGRLYTTLDDNIYVNGSKVYESHVNGSLVYPDDASKRFYGCPMFRFSGTGVRGADTFVYLGNLYSYYEPNIIGLHPISSSFSGVCVLEKDGMIKAPSRTGTWSVDTIPGVVMSDIKYLDAMVSVSFSVGSLVDDSQLTRLAMSMPLVRAYARGVNLRMRYDSDTDASHSAMYRPVRNSHMSFYRSGLYSMEAGSYATDGPSFDYISQDTVSIKNRPDIRSGSFLAIRNGSYTVPFKTISYRNFELGNQHYLNVSSDLYYELKVIKKNVPSEMYVV